MRLLDSRPSGWPWGEMVFAGLTALLFLLLTSTCSPLYAFNDWVDPNSFMSVGKGMLRGLVPYRDLFEQKGPLLYFIHALAYLIDRTGFAGVFIFEVINLAIALFLVGRITRLFAPRSYSWFTMPAFACLTLVSRSFEGGDSAEEFCLALTLGMLYIMASHFKNRPDEPLTWPEALLTGILGGCVLMIKYTLTGSWLGFAAALAVGCIGSGQLKGFLRNALQVLAGILVAVLPWLLYFAVNSALADFGGTYLLINFQLYGQQATLTEKLKTVAQAIGYGLNTNRVAGLIMICGLAAFTAGKRVFRTVAGRLALPAALAGQIMASYCGGKHYTYYFLALFPYLAFGLAALAGFVERRRCSRWSRHKLQSAILASVLILTAVTLKTSPNTPLMKLTGEDYPQIAFARIINEVPGATLLNAGFLDGGFYTAADITPHLRYFMLNNIQFAALPEMFHEQDRYIAEGLATFVVLRMNPDEDPAKAGGRMLHENYRLVAAQDLPYRGNQGLVFRYALYRIKDST